MKSSKKAVKWFLSLFLLILVLHVKADQYWDKSHILHLMGKQYGIRAVKRANTWFDILEQTKAKSEFEKLQTINLFFNQFIFIDDLRLWGESNYWATPLEFIGANGGDCEDFAIAKYFSLVKLGIDEEKLRITMVKSITLDQYHMVVSYYEKPNAIPLVLDNLDVEIKHANLRNDLVPVYSFNGQNLWLNKQKSQGVLAGSSSRLRDWQELNNRINIDQLRQPYLSLE